MLSNFKTALAARGLKQVDLAFELRIPPSSLSEIVHERRRPDASMRRRISQRLNADEQWLFATLIQIPQPTNPDAAEEFLKAT
jgi:transcriptional regulator with XRE-family HTH domain